MTRGGPPAPAPDPAVAAAIDRWRPASVPEPAAAFARTVVRAAAPGGPARARALLWAAGKLATFGISVGLPVRPDVLLHPSVIERCAVLGAVEASPVARRTLRTNLRFLAARVVPEICPRPAALPRERAKPPYSAVEITAYLALADAQPTVARRARAAGLVCLGAGAGLIRADLRSVRGVDVVRRSGGVVVQVRGRRPRVVPVLARYHEPLLAAAAFAGDGPVTGGFDPARRNLTTPLICALAGGADLPRLDTGRLRATWLRDCAARLGLATFLHAAGISCSQRLGDLVATLDVADEAGAVALLGDTR
jgi:hypothetical protein